jgi:hypothetical protein
VRVVIGSAMMVVSATLPAVAQPESVTDHWSVEFDAGFSSQYDDSEMWKQGYNAGVAGTPRAPWIPTLPFSK